MKKTKEFKKLQKEWYKKLKEYGFDDIEYFKEGEPGEWLKGNSKFNSEEAALTMSPQEEDSAQLHYETTFDYYSSARALSDIESNFLDETERQVWEDHSNGMSFRAIGKRAGFSHSKVMRIIDKYRRIHFGINKRANKV